MPATAHGALVGRSPRVAALLLACTLAGCTSTYVQRERIAPPALPAPLDAPLPLRLALADPHELRAAQPLLQVPPFTLRYRYEIGAPAAALLRQALAASVTELVDGPSDRADALLTLGAPGVAMEAPPRPGLWALRLSADLPVALADADGTPVAADTLAASAALVDPVPPFASRTPLNQGLLRNAAARLVAWVWTRAAPPTRDADADATGAGPAGRHTVLLRMDAGLAAGDRHEDRLTDCLAAVASPPPLAPGPSPAAALRDALFPWFDPGVLPAEPEAVAALLARPAVRARLAALDVGRLLLYTVRDVGSDKTDGLVCVSGPAGVCIGLYRETQLQVVDAALWDVAARRPLERHSEEMKRTGGVLGALLPIPFVSSNESEVCAHLRAFVAPGGATR